MDNKISIPNFNNNINNNNFNNNNFNHNMTKCKCNNLVIFNNHNTNSTNNICLFNKIIKCHNKIWMNKGELKLKWNNLE